MKSKLHKNKKPQNEYFDYEENGRHGQKKVLTHKQQKANNALDRALKQKNLKVIYDFDEYY